ncbi:putative ribonucleoside-diphosphate reductase small chain B [Carex littledalei]|uniref:Putative ribonucleoside-diphosphate reductase small chain B n=1 Tax=Carex littledalei TaxID=544730 RepID=A0A833VI78_9POAL|nr:putative ribonucleoside-diphosphate reductase small chain B [Carex littledalei]
MLHVPDQAPLDLEILQKALASFWTAEEIDLSHDMVYWEQILTLNERHYISHVLAFFASSDGIVLENLTTRFMSDVQIPEAVTFYGLKIAIGNIHSEAYSLLLEKYMVGITMTSF